ncbi:phospho-2-dehydro-3-deoxyheptonate aldolase [Mangrovihabitans endophyticus]|uniref:Phospho-2-dehydro-3-deoxyheptonate aldolase n=1 Tax=Mangrovihabitans endophyticus TaxID=1751298 RepID=A0A8J3FMJ8_9ACTN|nr:phospho-2-dehydro-3-deoxyheptonate aldolase [Mangrovihabitans endophyticus]
MLTVNETPAVIAQQPVWDDQALAKQVIRDLAARPPLVRPDACLALSTQLTAAGRGDAFVIQGGDCAEPFADSAGHRVRAKAALLHHLGDLFERVTGIPAVRIGRLAGQYSKPRSQPTESLPGVGTLPVYRGDAINSPEPTPDARRPDPRRMTQAYMATATALASLLPPELMFTGLTHHAFAPVFASHEALLLDLERPLLRRHGDRLFSSSAHMLWIGDRTRRLDGPHVAFAEAIQNPIGVKIGPSASPPEVAALVRKLAARRPPGNLALILRLGSDRVAHTLPPLLDALAAQSGSLLWMCDPMHGNTRRATDGEKTRMLDDITREIETFIAVLRRRGVRPSGIHLEMTPDDVCECDRGRPGAPLATPAPLCDPRLNPDQAERLVRRTADLMADAKAD